MAKSEEEMNAWFQNNDAELLGKSANELAQAVQDFAFMVGMYKEDVEVYQPAKQDLAHKNLWGSSPDAADGSIWADSFTNSDNQRRY
jgi:hypothetical protein